MKKFSVKSFLSGVIVCAVVMTGSTVLAEPVQKTIEAVFGQVKLVVDGKAVDNETLLYNGTTYVPLRAAADIFGKEVGWDEATRTAYIGQIPEQTSQTPAPAAAAPTQADLEKEYLKFMVDVYYSLIDSLDDVMAEVAKIEDNPMLVLDKDWIAGFKSTLGAYTADINKLASYDKAKVPDSYKEFHNTFCQGCEDFKAGADKLVYGLENLDMDALSEAMELMETAVENFEKASLLAPEF